MILGGDRQIQLWQLLGKRGSRVHRKSGDENGGKGFFVTRGECLPVCLSWTRDGFFSKGASLKHCEDQGNCHSHSVQNKALRLDRIPLLGFLRRGLGLAFCGNLFCC